jgi:hypothetical protein
MCHTVTTIRSHAATPEAPSQQAGASLILGHTPHALDLLGVEARNPCCHAGRQRPRRSAGSSREVVMLVITDGSTRNEITEAITLLRTKQQRMPMHWIDRRAEIGDSIDSLVDQWLAAQG